MTEDQEKILNAALDVCADLACFADMDCPADLRNAEDVVKSGCPCPGYDNECPETAGPLSCWRTVARYLILKQAGLSG